jgi:hypothetical protein
MADRQLPPEWTKQQVIDAITELIGAREMGVSRGSTEPKALFLAVHRRFGMRFDESTSKPALAQSICEVAGLTWDASCDSRNTPSGGGSTVTLEGLHRVHRAVQLLLARYG